MGKINPAQNYSADRQKGAGFVRDKVIVVLGPTASGKSALAIKLAKKFNSEIISADSRQVYLGMDIGTGKVSRDRRLKTKAKISIGFKRSTLDFRRSAEFYSEEIHHHLIDIVSPKKQFSVDKFVQLGQKAIADINKRGKVPIVCGGTGLYIDALIYNLPIPHVPPDSKLRAKLEKLSTAQLYLRLNKIDPIRAKTIDRQNPRRLIRALEIVITTGKPVPAMSTDYTKRDTPYNVLWVGLNPGQRKLNKNIEKRLDQRLRQGMFIEVSKLHNQRLSWQRLESFGLEYKWLAKFLQNKISRPDMRNGLLQDILRYSKRQMTWFKRNRNTHWVQSYKEAWSLTKNFLSQNWEEG